MSAGALAVPVDAVTSVPPVEPPLSGTYEVAESGLQFEVTFNADGSVQGRASGERACPAEGTVVFTASWSGTAYEGKTFQFVPGEDGSCTLALSYLASTLEIVSPTQLRWCTEASEIDPEGGACGTLRRSMTSYVVELVTWIGHDSIVDPSLPGPVGGLPPGLLELAPDALRPCLAAESVESSIPGQGHRDIGGPALATVRAAFTVSASGAISGFDSEVVPLTIERRVVGLFESGTPVECAQSVTLAADEVGSAVVTGDTVSLKFDTDLGIVPVSAAELAPGEAEVLRRLSCDDDGELSCDVTAVVPATPRIRASVDLVVKPDGTLTVAAQTPSFPSFGLRIFAEHEVVATVVLYDSICHRLAGDGGRTNLGALLARPHRLTATPVAALISHGCVPFALPGDGASPDDDFRQYPEKLPAFVLAVRYAESRGAAS